MATTPRLAFDQSYDRVRRQAERPRRRWRESQRHPKKYYAAKQLWTMVASVFAVLLALTASASAEEIVRHSGSIVAIAHEARTFVLAEVGPWQVRNGATVSTYRTVTLMPETQFAMVGRDDGGPSGFPGDFVEVPLAPEAVYLNDYVTVECRHEGKKMLALKITVTELPDADTGVETLR